MDWDDVGYAISTAKWWAQEPAMSSVLCQVDLEISQKSVKSAWSSIVE